MSVAKGGLRSTAFSRHKRWSPVPAATSRTLLPSRRLADSRSFSFAAALTLSRCVLRLCQCSATSADAKTKHGQLRGRYCSHFVALLFLSRADCAIRCVGPRNREDSSSGISRHRVAESCFPLTADWCSQRGYSCAALRTHGRLVVNFRLAHWTINAIASREEYNQYAGRSPAISNTETSPTVPFLIASPGLKKLNDISHGSRVKVLT